MYKRCYQQNQNPEPSSSQTDCVYKALFLVYRPIKALYNARQHSPVHTHTCTDGRGCHASCHWVVRWFSASLKETSTLSVQESLIWPVTFRLLVPRRLKVFDGVEVRTPCRPVKFFHTKLENHVFLDLALSIGVLWSWNRRGSSLNCYHKVETHYCLKYWMLWH